MSKRIIKAGILAAGAVAAGSALYKFMQQCDTMNRNSTGESGQEEASVFEKFAERFSDPDEFNNIVLSRNLRLSMDDERTGCNQNVLLFGGERGSYVGTNLLQMNASYIVTDPGGEYLRRYGKALEHCGYRIKCLNLQDAASSNHYNPLCYIRKDADIVSLAEVVLENMIPHDSADYADPFWRKAEISLLTALIAYLHFHAKPEYRHLSSAVKLLWATVNRNDFADPFSDTCLLDELFRELEGTNPEDFAVGNYQVFLMRADRHKYGVIRSLAEHTQCFLDEQISELTETDDLDLESVCDEKTALFIVAAPEGGSVNPLGAVLCTQLIRYMIDYSGDMASLSSLILDSDGHVVRAFPAAGKQEAGLVKNKAEEYFKKATMGELRFCDDRGRWELCAPDGEVILWRGTREDAQAAFDALKRGSVVINQECKDRKGYALPVRVHFMLDSFCELVGHVPDFPDFLSVCRIWDISFSILTETIASIKKMYPEHWEEIFVNCDAQVCLDGTVDEATAKWFCALVKDGIAAQREAERFNGVAPSRDFGTDFMFVDELRQLEPGQCVVSMKGFEAVSDQRCAPERHPRWSLVQN